jgi:hypothetical protein
MIQAVTLTTAEELWPRITKWLVSVKRTDQIDRFTLQGWVNGCDQLAKTDVVTASLYKAAVYSMARRNDEVERWLRNAENNGARDKARLWRVMHLANQLRASEAQALADVAFEHRGDMNFATLMEALSAVGAVHSIVKAADNAQERNELLKNMTPMLQINRRADRVLSELSLTQADVAAMLDVAGEVLREHNLQWLDETPIFDVFDGECEFRELVWKFKVWVTPQEAQKLNDELIEKLIQRNLDHNGLLVWFLGADLSRQVH